MCRIRSSVLCRSFRFLLTTVTLNEQPPITVCRRPPESLPLLSFPGSGLRMHQTANLSTLFCKRLSSYPGLSIKQLHLQSSAPGWTHNG